MVVSLAYVIVIAAGALTLVLSLFLPVAYMLIFLLCKTNTDRVDIEQYFL